MADPVKTPIELFPPQLARLFLPPFDDSRVRMGCTLLLIDSEEGTLMDVATDGKMLLAVLCTKASNRAGWPCSPPDKLPGKLASLRKLLTEPVVETLFADLPVAELAAWAGPVDAVKYGPCDCCGGDGECECPRCDKTHKCGHCEGTGRERDYNARHGTIGPLCLDLNYLARLLEGRDLGTCTVTTRAVTKGEKDLPALRLDGKNWLALMMPLQNPDASAPVFVREAKS
jgi:hypothetical protein